MLKQAKGRRITMITLTALVVAIMIVVIISTIFNDDTRMHTGKQNTDDNFSTNSILIVITVSSSGILNASNILTTMLTDTDSGNKHVTVLAIRTMITVMP